MMADDNDSDNDSDDQGQDQDPTKHYLVGSLMNGSVVTSVRETQLDCLEGYVKIKREVLLKNGSGFWKTETFNNEEEFERQRDEGILAGKEAARVEEKRRIKIIQERFAREKLRAKKKAEKEQAKLLKSAAQSKATQEAANDENESQIEAAKADTAKSEAEEVKLFKLAAEEQAKGKVAEEKARHEEEQAKRKLAEEEEIFQEEQAKRKLAEDEEIRQEEQAKRKVAEEEEIRQEEEAKRKVAEERVRRKEKEAKRKLVEEEEIRQEEESKRKVAEERVRHEEEEGKRKVAEEEKILQEEEAKRKVAEEKVSHEEEEAKQKVAEEEKILQEEEAKRKVAEERVRHEEEEAERTVTEKEKGRQEDEAKRERAEEHDRQKLAEDQDKDRREAAEKKHGEGEEMKRKLAEEEHGELAENTADGNDAKVADDNTTHEGGGTEGEKTLGEAKEKVRRDSVKKESKKPEKKTKKKESKGTKKSDHRDADAKTLKRSPKPLLEAEPSDGKKVEEKVDETKKKKDDADAKKQKRSTKRHLEAEPGDGKKAEETAEETKKKKEDKKSRKASKSPGRKSKMKNPEEDAATIKSKKKKAKTKKKSSEEDELPFDEAKEIKDAKKSATNDACQTGGEKAEQQNSTVEESTADSKAETARRHDNGTIHEAKEKERAEERAAKNASPTGGETAELLWLNEEQQNPTVEESTANAKVEPARGHVNEAIHESKEGAEKSATRDDSPTGGETAEQHNPTVEEPTVDAKAEPAVDENSPCEDEGKGYELSTKLLQIKKSNPTFAKIMGVWVNREEKSTYVTPLVTVKRPSEKPPVTLTLADMVKKWEAEWEANINTKIKGPREGPPEKLRNVCAETLDIAVPFKAPVFKKSEKEKKWIQKSFDDTFVFDDLTPSEMGPIVDAFQRVEYEKGATIAVEGEAEGVYSIVQSGEVTFHKGDNQIGSAGAGEAFGETALLYSCPRAVSVKCGDHQTVVFEINHMHFRRIVREQIIRSEEEKLKLLKSVPMFKDLDKIDLLQLSHAMVQHTFNEGDNLSTIFKEAPFCLVQEGLVVATDATIGPGESFGEEAFTKEREVARHDVKATSDGVAFTIDRESFEKVFGDYSRVSLKHQDKQTLVSALY
jgi:hypothetical protein